MSAAPGRRRLGIWSIGYVAYGSGIARYIDNVSGQNADLDRNDAGTDVTALPALGTYAAFTHQWPRRFRSTGVLGYSGIDNTAAQAAPRFGAPTTWPRTCSGIRPGRSTSASSICSGRTRSRAGADAHASRIQFAAKYDLFRKRALEQ